MERARTPRGWRTLLAGLVLALLAAAGPGTAVARPAPAAGCPAVAGVFLPGTWETTPNADERTAVGMLAPVALALADALGERFAFRFPAYAATAFDRMPYGDSKATGVEAATAALDEFGRNCPATRFVLAGYSQGADAMGDVAARIGCTGAPIAADRVLAIGLIADPRQGTGGATLVGPPVSGPGIAGPRPGGFCAVAPVTTQICAEQDRYCAADTAAHPLLAGLGRLLSRPTASGASEPGDPATAALHSTLITDFDDVRLAELPTAVARLAAEAPHAAAAHLAAVAGGVAATLRPLRDMAAWAGDHASVRAELTGAAGSILDAASESDLDSALRALGTIIARSERPGAFDGIANAQAAEHISVSIAPLVETLTVRSGTELDIAARTLADKWPAVLVDRVAGVAARGLEFAANTTAIVHILNRAAGAVGGGDLAAVVRHVHDLFAQLGQAFEPLLATVGADLREVSRLLGLIPDESGATRVAAQLVRALAEIDAAALTGQVDLLEADLWRLADTVGRGAPPLDIAAQVTALLPTLFGFVGLAVDNLTGAAGAELQRVANTLLGAAGSPDSGAQLLEEALSTALFVTSGAHQSYGTYVVDAQGRTAVQWLGDWFVDRALQG